MDGAALAALGSSHRPCPGLSPGFGVSWSSLCSLEWLRFVSYNLPKPNLCSASAWLCCSNACTAGVRHEGFVVQGCTKRTPGA